MEKIESKEIINDKKAYLQDFKVVLLDMLRAWELHIKDYKKMVKEADETYDKIKKDFIY